MVPIHYISESLKVVWNMKEPFLMNVLEIQPSQLFLSAEKVNKVRAKFKNNPSNSKIPIPIKNLGNKVIFTNGHTRAFVLWQKGYNQIEVEWENEELDWKIYQTCVKWCEDYEIHTIADLKNRIISHKRYQVEWIQRCQNEYKRLHRSRV